MKVDPTKKNCTIPQFLGFGEWFQKYYGAACTKHDQGYIDRVKTRVEVDWEFYQDMLHIANNLDKSEKEKRRHRAFCWMAYRTVRLLGAPLWYT